MSNETGTPRTPPETPSRFGNSYSQAVAKWKKTGCGKMSMCVEQSLYEAIQAELRPGDNTIEFGSGLSTFAFASRFTTHTCVENNPDQYAIVDKIFGDCMYSGLAPQLGWYVAKMHVKRRVILVDGPSQADGGNRLNGFDTIMQCAQPNTVFFIDDVHRGNELLLAQKIAAATGREIQFTDRWARI